MKSTILFLFLLFCFGVFSQSTRRDIDSIENIIKTTRNTNRIIAEKAVLTLKYFTSGDTKKAYNLYNTTLRKSLSLEADSGLALLYHTRGTLFYYESVYDSALHYFERALAMRKSIKDHIGILKSTGNIGAIYFMFGDYKKALTYFEEVLKKEAELHFDEGEHLSINNLGTIYKALRLYDKANMYYRKAEKIYTRKNLPGQLIYTYDGLSGVYEETGKMDSALYFAFKGKQLAESLNDVRSAAYALLNIGIYHMKLKKYDLAKNYLDTSLAMAENFQDKKLQLAAYGNLAAIELRQDRSDSAMKYIEKIAPLQEQLQSKSEAGDLAEIFAKYYYDKKDYQLACEYLDKSRRYKDSIYNIETANQISEMQTKYETEKKEKENQVLQAENKTYRATRNYLLIILVIAILGAAGAIIAYKKIKSSKELIGIQKHLVEEKQKEILDSINYARRIQFALLASDNLLQSHLPDHFVMFKPKDVVSGDFYWATPTSEGFIYVTADCTGHGVPGAFMSLLNISKLSQAINESNITRPDLILNEVRTEIIKALNPEGSKEVSKDGMDAVVCKLNVKENKLQFSAAHNSFYIIRNKQLMTCEADKMPVGKGHDDSLSFTFNEVHLEKGDVIYTFTDGFADQFGGALGKKFKYKQFEELLLAIHLEPMQEQKQKLNDAFENWKGKLEQVDDVCVIGVRI